MRSIYNFLVRAGRFLLTSLILLAYATPSGATLPPVPEGVVHFHTSGTSPHLFQALYNPEASGGEMILWWSDVEKEQGRYDWSVVQNALDRYALAGKNLDIRISTAHNGPNFTPAWLFEKVGVRRIGRGFWEDFESLRAIYDLTNHAQLTSGALLNGPIGNILSAKNDTSEKRLILTLSGPAKLTPDCAYSAQWDCEAPIQCRFGVRLMQGESLIQEKTFTQKAGWAGPLGFAFHTPPGAPGRLEWWIEGPGAIRMDHVNVIKILERPKKQVSDFESNLGDWLPGSGARLLQNTDQALEGEGCLEVKNAGAGGHLFLKNNPATFAPQMHQGYQFSILCHALTDTRIEGRLVHPDMPEAPMGARTVTVKKGETVRIGCHSGTYTWKPGFQAQWRMTGLGHILVDNATYKIWSDRVLCYPDYFDPAFFENWKALLEDFARQFRDHPALGCISVGGFGRWEEVILEEESPGLLDAQWLARGYSQETYLAHIAQCMDLYRELFPGHPLRVCLAYGLKQGKKAHWIYRRVAQAAIERNIGLKQNGLSEKYDTWDDNTDASYLYHRYRKHPHISLTHETGGNIFSNSIGAMGHPVSLINRGLMNNMDVLFLYRPDIHSRHVAKYFTYFNALAGRPLFTRFYCHLRREELTHSAATFPIEYFNQWLGIRQVDHKIAHVEYLELDGEKCARTTPGNDRIFFDVDDRAQYDGMFGVVIRVEYLDDAPGRFALGCTNSWTGEWDVIGFVEKEGAGKWKVVDFMHADWCDSPRNVGPDTQVDLAIHDVGPGETAIRNVEIHFVPASGWKMRPLLEEKTTNHHSLPGQTMRRVLPNASFADAPPYRLTMPLWAQDPEGTFSAGRLLTWIQGNEIEISRKDYALPANGDRVFLPFVPRMAASQYAVEFYKSQGLTAWRLNPQGEGAINLYAYENAPQALTPQESAFLAKVPFNGLQWQGKAPKEITLRRWLEGRGWSDAITSAALQSQAGVTRFYCEPQAPGKFRLSGPGLQTAKDWQLLTLIRELPTHQQTRFPSGGVPGQTWDFRQPAAIRGWGLPEETNSNPEGLEIAFADTVPRIDSPALDWQAQQADLLRLEVQNLSASGLARVYWRSKEQAFSPERSFWFALAPYDAHTRLYRYPIGLEPGWQGAVAQLRILLGGNSPMTGQMTLQALALERQREALALDFDSAIDTLVPREETAQTQVEGGLLRVHFPKGQTDVLEIPASSFNFEAHDNQVLELIIRTNALRPEKAEFRWWVLGHPHISAEDALDKTTPLSHSFTLPQEKERFQLVRLSLGKSPQWQGHISRMAIALPAPPEGTLLEIQSLLIRSAP